ncbi:MAG TPA: hypothetical protein VLW85_14210 [Myxococcales bacterium]|nr:hypothetical protein [Myxococcales bacterium]
MLALLPLACSSSGAGDSGGGRPGPAWPGKAIWVDVGHVNTCAVASDGTGYCWGSNANVQTTWPHDPATSGCGQVASTADGWPCIASVPVPITGGVSWKFLSYGADGILCGIDRSAALSCFSPMVPADNFVDYPADVTTDAHNQPLCSGMPCGLVPLKVKGGGTWNSFRFGFSAGFACGLRSDGSAACLGGNGQYGSLGSGTTIAEVIKTPRAVAGSHTFTQVAVAFGGNHACGLANDQTVWCWGQDDMGALGYGSATPANRFPQGVPYPVATAGGYEYKWITAGSRYSLGLDLTGKAYCWGTSTAGSFGNGGNGSTQTAIAPTPCAAGMSFAQVEAGIDTTCAIDSAGDGWCWGANSRGQVGIGTATASVSTPQKVSGGLNWKRIVPGEKHSCGIASDDTLWCWGAGDSGELGAPSAWVVNAGTDSHVPIQVGK